MRIVVELAGAPRGKGRGRAFVTKIKGQVTARVFTDAKTRTYEAQLRYAAQQVMGDRLSFSEPCSVIVEARFEVPQSWSKRRRADALAGLIRPATTPDCDNLLKCLDAANGVIFLDDRQIVEATIRKIYSDRPGLTIIVETIDPPPVVARPAVAGDLFAEKV